jgi:hypothetical protein
MTYKIIDKCKQKVLKKGGGNSVSRGPVVFMSKDDDN